MVAVLSWGLAGTQRRRSDAQAVGRDREDRVSEAFQGWLAARYVAGPQAVAGMIMVPVPLGRLPFFLADTGKSAGEVDLPAPLVAAPTDIEMSELGAQFYVATMDSAGVAQLHAFAPAGDTPLGPLVMAPGRPLWPEIPLASRELPVRLLALPAPPPRVG